VILELHVQPGAARSEFAGEHGGRVKLRIAAGLKSRRKRVVIEGAQWTANRN